MSEQGKSQIPSPCCNFTEARCLTSEDCGLAWLLDQDNTIAAMIKDARGFWACRNKGNSSVGRGVR